MTAPKQQKYVVRIHLPGGKIRRMTVRAFNPNAAQRIAFRKYPNATKIEYPGLRK